MDRTSSLILCLIVVVMALRVHLAIVYEVNWDEFFNLSKVHLRLNGTLTESLQTGFVHLFGWIGLISANEVDQMVAVRLVMLALNGLVVWFLIAIARQFLPLHAALFAALCYVAFVATMRQGASFRTDAMAIAPIMAAYWVVITQSLRLRNAVAAGLVMAVAGMITIKAVFHVPAVAAVLLIRLYFSEARRQTLIYGLTVGGVGAAGFAALLALHMAVLTDPDSPIAFLKWSVAKTLTGATSVIAQYLPFAISDNPVFVAAFAGGVIAVVVAVFRRHRLKALSLLALALPLASFGYYSQTYPYFYPFVLAPAAILCGAGILFVQDRAGRALALAASALIGVKVALIYPGLTARTNDLQRQTVAVVHKMFPEPVPYIDRAGMVSSFPKEGFFMSVWLMGDYYARGEPIMNQLLRTKQPKFLIANRPMLEFANLVPERAGPEHFGLFEPDIRALADNFIPHWGRIAIAAKQFVVQPGQEIDFEILIEGPYTVEAVAPVRIDSAEYAPGQVVDLRAGEHQLVPTSGGSVILRWGNDLYRPVEPASGGKLFHGF